MSRQTYTTGMSRRKEALVSHISNVTKHYGSDAYAWDVVNEALTDSYPTGTFKTNTWYPAVPDYVDVAFHAAYEATKGVSWGRERVGGGGGG